MSPKPRSAGRALGALGCAALASAFSLVGCDESGTQNAEYFVFGTLVEVTISGADADLASDALGELQWAFQHMHEDWHPWEPGQLSEINYAFANGDPAPADRDILTLLRASQDYERLTNGLFNPAIGELVALWGFHTSDFPIVGPPPSASEIARIVATRPSASDIVIDDGMLVDTRGYARLDFSGLAKGLAVDRACEMLQRLGIEHALINAGGDLRGFGRNGERRWRVGVRNPLGGVIGTIELDGDEAVFTSGNYERFRVDEREARYAHILNPKTGWPAEDVMAVTVIAPEGIKADAAATALVVAGLSGWREVAGPMGIEALLLTDDRGRIHGTRPMLDRISLSAGLRATLLEME